MFFLVLPPLGPPPPVTDSDVHCESSGRENRRGRVCGSTREEQQAAFINSKHTGRLCVSRSRPLSLLCGPEASLSRAKPTSSNQKGGEMKKRGYSIMCARAQGSTLSHGVRETLVVEPFAPLHDLCSNYKVVALYTACITI